MPHVGIVTCRVKPEPDPDEVLLLAALGAEGLEAETIAWDNADAEPAAFALLVLRSPWNYPEDPAAFEAWLAAADASTRLLNPLPVLRRNLHKQYLRDLRAAGLPVVPTAFVPAGSAGSGGGLAATAIAWGWDDVVVKPAISAASWRTRRFRIDDFEAGGRFLAELGADGRDALVQPYLASVEREPERSIVMIDGACTHVVEKRPRFAGEEESVSGALPLREGEAALAERAVEAACGTSAASLLYARLDLLRDDQGRTVISEVECVEPSLFLSEHPPALARLVAAIAREARAVAPVAEA